MFIDFDVLDGCFRNVFFRSLDFWGRCDNAGESHLIVADVKADGARHKAIIVFTFNSSERSVLFLFVGKIFVQGLFVALYIKGFANDLDEKRDDHGFGRGVGMESPFAGDAFYDVFLGLFAGIEFVVNRGDLIENKPGLVAVQIAILVFRLKGIGFDDQKRAVVKSSYLGRLPCQQVVVDMSVPFGNDFRLVPVEHPMSVQNQDVGVVRRGTATAHIDNREITVGYFLRAVRKFPYLQVAVLVGGKG